MKKIKFIIITAIFFSVDMLLAQSIDMNRMERDIEVAENILATLLKDEQRGRFWMESINGTFVEDYGVILTLPKSQLRPAMAGELRSFSYATSSGNDEKNVMIVDGDGDNIVTVNVPKAEIKKVNRDSIESLQKEKIIDVMKLFLMDYGNLISQLKPEHKILITNRENQFHWMTQNKGLSELSAEAKIEDINAYKAGKISSSVLTDRIIITDRTYEEEKSIDLELLSSIMGRLYKNDLSNTYYSSTNPNYNRLANFGVIYHMKVYSSTENEGKHRIITRNLSNLSRQERDDLVKSMYPEFLNSLKENMLDYGKTVTSLKDDEILMFQVGMTKCEGCNLPKEVEISIKSNVLKKYGQGKISKEQALKEFKVSEGQPQ